QHRGTRAIPNACSACPCTPPLLTAAPCGRVAAQVLVASKFQECQAPDLPPLQTPHRSSEALAPLLETLEKKIAHCNAAIRGIPLPTGAGRPLRQFGVMSGLCAAAAVPSAPI